MPKFKEYNQNQLQLLPQDLESKIAPDHLARLINKAVDDMDLSFIENTYSNDGQHAFNPRMLLKVLVYGYSLGLRGSRKLTDRLREDIVFMWLSGRNTPDFRTISDFRKDKLVEPVIGNIKRNMEFRRFNLRGKDKCRLEIGLVSVAHNLKKIKNHIKRLIYQGDGRQETIELGTVLGYLPA